MPSTKKKPTCLKGYNCGKICLQRTKACASALEGEAKNYAEWLQKKAEGNGVSSKPPKLPDGVRKEVDEDMTSYVFEIGGKEVQMNFFAFNNGAGRLAVFEVGGSVSNSDLSPDDKALAARRLSQVFEYDVSRSRDGTVYECTADGDGDGNDYKRAAAYTRMGFSVPLGGEVGEAQSAVVKNGKIDREATEAFAKTAAEESSMTYGDTIAVWNATSERERAKRTVERSERRNSSARQ